MKIGDRCRLTGEASQMFERMPVRTGVILRKSGRGDWVIKFDGQKTPQYWHKDFIEASPLPSKHRETP